MAIYEQRVLVRDRAWRVQSTSGTAGAKRILTLLDPDNGETLQVLTPPEKVEILPDEAPVFARQALSPWAPWIQAHEILRHAATDSGDEFAALYSGRLSPQPYQFEPLRRMLQLPRPALLIADDVGLGKTIEAGICLVELMARGRAGRMLIIVPPGLISQWQDEMIEKFSLEFTGLENAAAVDRAQTNLPDGVKPWQFLDRVITSVEYIKKREVLRTALETKWDIIVVDEAHYLAESGTPKNPHATARTRLGRQLRDSCRALLLLTATPHNGYSHSFRSLLEIVEPTDATFVGDKETIHRRVNRTMIRRLKPQIYKTGENDEKLPAFQLRVPVRAIPVTGLSEDEKKIFRKVSAYCARTAAAAVASDDRDLIGFAMQIIKKRMLSSRTALSETLGRRLDALKSKQEVEDPPPRSEVLELRGDLPVSEAAGERIASRIVRSAIPKEKKRRNSEARKLREIKKLLAGIEELPDPKIQTLLADLKNDVFPVDGEKAIIFTEYRDTLSAIRDALESDDEWKGGYTELTGGLTSRQRRARMALFERPETRLMLATDAASEGLNLQAFCRRIYHFELPWNPNRLEQRNGRVDRFGQSRPPIIRYLYYPDSPEDDILNRLIRRIVEMQSEDVSTPDILGIVASARIEETLTRINAEETGNEGTQNLFEVMKKRQYEFAEEMAPLLAVAESPGETSRDKETFSADPIIGDDLELESGVLGRLGRTIQPGPHPHTYSLRTPYELMGPGVEDLYSCFTMRRSVAVKYPFREVAFINRLHPLFKAMTNEALTKLTGTHSPDMPVRRISARRHPAAAKAPFAVFIFLASRSGIPICLVSAAVDRDGHPVEEETGRLVLGSSDSPGEVSWETVSKTFKECFPQIQQDAEKLAVAQIKARADHLRKKRERLAVILREDAERYRTDRMEEIDREEKTARKTADDGQLELFDLRSVSGFKAKRAAVETHHKKRLEEIEMFVDVPDPNAPQPLGVVFVFPPEADNAS